MKKSAKITLVGAGNVAWHLGHRLVDTGSRIMKIISRKSRRADELSHELNCPVSQEFRVRNTDSDFLIVAVDDTYLKEILENLSTTGTIILHTSGSLGMDVFGPATDRYGVIYPLQTLTAGVPVDFSSIPLCIEGSDSTTLAEIGNLASQLSSVVNYIDSYQRRILHLAGVISNNFTNHLITLAIEVMEKNHLDRELLMPLLEETISKLRKTDPYNAQTGPARRHNTEIINQHLELLSSEPRLKKLYSIISDSIIAYYSRS